MSASGLWPVHDPGDGDLLGLEAQGETCTTWRWGRGPWGIVLVERSLLAYVERCAELAAANDGHRERFAPRSKIAPRAAAELRALPATDDEQRWLRALPDASVVFDFREAPVGRRGGSARRARPTREGSSTSGTERSSRCVHASVLSRIAEIARRRGQRFASFSAKVVS